MYRRQPMQHGAEIRRAWACVPRLKSHGVGPEAWQLNRGPVRTLRVTCMAAEQQLLLIRECAPALEAHAGRALPYASGAVSRFATGTTMAADSRQHMELEEGVPPGAASPRMRRVQSAKIPALRSWLVRGMAQVPVSHVLVRLRRCWSPTSTGLRLMLARHIPVHGHTIRCTGITWQTCCCFWEHWSRSPLRSCSTHGSPTSL